MFYYIENSPRSGVFNCRGEVGPKDDPSSNARMMARSGLRCAMHKEDKGRGVKLKDLGEESIVKV